MAFDGLYNTACRSANSRARTRFISPQAAPPPAPGFMVDTPAVGLTGSTTAGQRHAHHHPRPPPTRTRLYGRYARRRPHRLYDLLEGLAELRAVLRLLTRELEAVKTVSVCRGCSSSSCAWCKPGVRRRAWSSPPCCRHYCPRSPLQYISMRESTSARNAR